jgi:hypothetical protein
MSVAHKDLHSKLTLGGLLVSLGIIYGDIGTSPLYVMKAILGDHIINADIVLGGISCVFWTLTLQTTIKYVLITLSADNHGEGGIFALYALVKKTKLTFVCSIVNTQVSESDHRISVAGNRFQLKLLNLIEPEITINISPYFLDRSKSANGLSSIEFFLDTQILGPRPLKIIGKVIGDSLYFISFIVI